MALETTIVPRPPYSLALSARLKSDATRTFRDGLFTMAAFDLPSSPLPSSPLPSQLPSPGATAAPSQSSAVKPSFVPGPEATARKMSVRPFSGGYACFDSGS